jgi:hypothetical protein
MTGSVLHVLQRDAGFTCAGDEEDPQRVRPDLGSAVERGATSQTAHHPPRLRLIHATAGLGDEQRASRATVQILVKRTYNRRSEDGSIAAAALALQAQDPMPSVMCKMFDVTVEGFTYTHTRVRQQAQQSDAAQASVLLRRQQQPPQLVARQPGCLASVANLRPSHVLRWRRRAHLFGNKEVVPT